MSAESLDEQRAQILRKRLWGATILIALAVIILPLLLDGSGSESQFRRVERLREEPPRVINSDGSREIVAVPETVVPEQDSWWQRMKRRFTENPPPERTITRASDARNNGVLAPNSASRADDTTFSAESAQGPDESVVRSEVSVARFQAWVVQAGSFRDESNALAVRDRLRRAGYPSFVTLSDDASVFRVRVGPMIDKGQAGNVRDAVVDLLGRDALVMPYP